MPAFINGDDWGEMVENPFSVIEMNLHKGAKILEELGENDEYPELIEEYVEEAEEKVNELNEIYAEINKIVDSSNSEKSSITDLGKALEKRSLDLLDYLKKILQMSKEVVKDQMKSEKKEKKKSDADADSLVLLGLSSSKTLFLKYTSKIDSKKSITIPKLKFNSKEMDAIFALKKLMSVRLGIPDDEIDDLVVAKNLEKRNFTFGGKICHAFILKIPRGYSVNPNPQDTSNSQFSGMNWFGLGGREIRGLNAVSKEFVKLFSGESETVKKSEMIVMTITNTGNKSLYLKKPLGFVSANFDSSLNPFDILKKMMSERLGISSTAINQLVPEYVVAKTFTFNGKTCYGFNIELPPRFRIDMPVASGNMIWKEMGTGGVRGLKGLSVAFEKAFV